MDRIIFGDNHFFGIQHASEEKSRALSLKYADDANIIHTLLYAHQCGVNSFMCTTHERMKSICRLIENYDELYSQLKVYPCMPYAHKYVNAFTESGPAEALASLIPGNLLKGLFKGGKAILKKDYISLMEMLIDAEMAPFNQMQTPVIFLQNTVTDLLLGLGLDEFFIHFNEYVEQRYQAKSGFITMNFPKLDAVLKSLGIKTPIICTSINKIGYRMPGGNKVYEEQLEITDAQIIAMQVLAAGVIPVKQALDYVCKNPAIHSVLFGASQESHISETVQLINQYDSLTVI